MKPEHWTPTSEIPDQSDRPERPSLRVSAIRMYHNARYEMELSVPQNWGLSDDEVRRAGSSPYYLVSGTAMGVGETPASSSTTTTTAAAAGPPTTRITSCERCRAQVFEVVPRGYRLTETSRVSIFQIRPRCSSSRSHLGGSVTICVPLPATAGSPGQVVESVPIVILSKEKPRKRVPHECPPDMPFPGFGAVAAGAATGAPVGSPPAASVAAVPRGGVALNVEPYGVPFALQVPAMLQMPVPMPEGPAHQRRRSSPPREMGLSEVDVAAQQGPTVTRKDSGSTSTSSQSVSPEHLPVAMVATLVRVNRDLVADVRPLWVSLRSYLASNVPGLVHLAVDDRAVTELSAGTPVVTIVLIFQNASQAEAGNVAFASWSNDLVLCGAL